MNRHDGSTTAHATKAVAAPLGESQRRLLLGGWLLLLLAWAAVPALADSAYSYLRTVEGYGELRSAEDGELFEIRENHPILAGDWMRVGGSSRVETVLADGSVARFAGGSEVWFEALAWTADSADTVTRVRLERGQAQLVVGNLVAGDESLEVETGNAMLYLRPPGRYTVRVVDLDVTEVVVREGFAEATTAHGSIIVRDGEAAIIEGLEWPSVELVEAGGYDRLERWGEELEAEARLAASSEVEPELRYRAARMDRYGAWVDVGDRRGWRPHVGSAWRPYHDGSWVYTPSGLTWVSAEPWGWVPYHYGTWDLVPGYGWLWFAGSHYAPAWVYWYWGPTHVAWVPSGYYTAYYAPHGRRYSVGPRFGIHGWAGGHWSFFAEWVFCPTRYFGRGHYRDHYRVGRDAARYSSFREVPRGVIATDTRSLKREVWGDSEGTRQRLEAAHARSTRSQMRDVSEFVARRREVSPEVASATRLEDMGAVRRGRPVATEPSPTAGRAVGRSRWEATPEMKGRGSSDRSQMATDRARYGRPEISGSAQRGGAFERDRKLDEAEEVGSRGRATSVDRRDGGRATLDLRRYGRPESRTPTDRSKIGDSDIGRSIVGRSEAGRSSAGAPSPSGRYEISDRFEVRGRSDAPRARTESPRVRLEAPRATRGSSVGRRVIDQVRRTIPSRPPTRSSSSARPQARPTPPTSSRSVTPPPRSSSPPPRATSGSSSRRSSARGESSPPPSGRSSSKGRASRRKPPGDR